MKIGIIGAGFTGLAAGYYLTRDGHDVEILERDSLPGGLAIGYQEKGWKWTLEQHYHHWFTNDKSVLELAKEINHKVVIVRPKTSSFVDNEILQLDSPVSLLKFKKLSLPDRFRMGATIASLRYNPFWQPLENVYAEPYLKKMMGEKGYKTVFEPLMVNKLGKYSHDMSLAWFWARISKRTPSLAYPEGGFLDFAQHLDKVIKKQGGKILYNTEVIKLSSDGSPTIEYKNKNKKTIKKYDAVLVTLPSFLFQKISPDLPTSYTDRLKKLKGIGAINLVMRLKKPFFNEGTYWLNMSDPKSDILAVVEHTNFQDSKNYNNEHLVYVGNYLPTTDGRYIMSDKDLLKRYTPWLKKINPDFEKSLIGYKVFRAPFAQPIIFPKYSKLIPPFKTPLDGVFLANIEQVYPWDRGTNYAVQLGKKVASLIEKN